MRKINARCSRGSEPESGPFCMFIRLAQKIAANPTVYDWTQRVVGGDVVYDRLAPYLRQTDGQSILDVGAGTGTIQSLVPANTTYIWLDNDKDKLRGYKRKYPAGLAVLGGASGLCFTDKSIDQALCLAMSHHVKSASLELMFQEISRVVRKRLIFVDALECRVRVKSRILWTFDRGRFARSSFELRSFIARYFIIDHIEEFTVWHRYLLCIATPK
jgi:SAM-dependent methyltransferase